MPIQNEKFSLLVSNSSGNPLTGALVELRKDATIYTCTEVGNGWYSIASIPTGKYSVFVDSVDTGETKAVGSGQVAALGNTADNVPVSNATEYDFQDPTTLKTTLSLNNVANVAVPSPTGSDANKVIQVDSNGDYVLSSIAASGFESVYEVLTTSDLSAALSAEYDSKLLVITREDFNFTNAQTFEVWGSCSIIVANTSESFQWSSNAVNATFNLKSGADAALTGMFFLNGVIAFGDNSDYTLNIPWKVTNLDFISPEVSRSVDGTSTLTYELLKASIPVSVTVTTAQDWWQNSAADKLDTVVAGTNITIDNTDPQNPIINSTASGGTPGGSDTQVQFNDGGAFGGDAGLTYNKTTDALTLLGTMNGELGFISYNQNTNPYESGFLSVYGTSDLANEKRYSSFKQFISHLQITAGFAGTVAENYIEFWAAPPSTQEVKMAEFRHNLADFLYDLKVQGLSTLEDKVTTNNGVVNFKAGEGFNEGFIDVYGTSHTNTKYISIKQRSTFSRITAGSSSAGVNELEFWIADSSSNENSVMTIKDFGINLSSRTNASPTNGDIWYDGTNTNIQGDVEVSNASDVARVTVEAPTGNAGSGASAGINLLMGGTGADWNILSTNGGNNLRFYAGGVDLMTLSSSGELYVNQGKVNIAEVLKLSSYTNSSPVEGDLWYDGTNLKFRDATTTRTISWT